MKPNKLYYNCINIIPILQTKTVLKSPIYSRGVSMSVNPDLKSHGFCKIIFKKSNWFSQMQPCIYLTEVAKENYTGERIGGGWISHYLDQYGNRWERGADVPNKTHSDMEHEQEWFSGKDVHFNLEDIEKIVIDKNNVCLKNKKKINLNHLKIEIEQFGVKVEII